MQNIIAVPAILDQAKRLDQRERRTLRPCAQPAAAKDQRWALCILEGIEDGLR